MTKNKEQQHVQLFNNRFLEALTRTSPFITLITYSAIIAAFLALSNHFTQLTTRTVILTYGAGIISWTLLEYLLHRYVFHFVSENRFLKRIPYLLHGVHHEAPRDDSRLFMPPVPGILIISILWFISYLLLRDHSFSFIAGLVNGYLLYAAMHYSMHVYKAPKYLRKLWVHHALHHYKYHDKAFGVSSMLWDRIFRTMPPVKEQSGVMAEAPRDNSPAQKTYPDAPASNRRDHDQVAR